MAHSIYSLKKEVVEICRRVYQRGYVAANDGNVSARIDDDRVVLTPTGMSKGFLQPADLVVVDMEGKVVAGTRRPSSESKMHLTIYGARPDIRAVVHAHPPTATGFAVAGIPLTECVLPEVIISVGSIPIAEYAAPGTQELAEVVSRYLKSYDAVMLENHGAITVGETVTSAHFKMETMEHFAKIMLVARLLGNVQGLSPRDVQDLIEQRVKYGIRSDSPTCSLNDGTCAPPPSRAEPAPDISSELIEEVTRQVVSKLKQPS